MADNQSIVGNMGDKVRPNSQSKMDCILYYRTVISFSIAITVGNAIALAVFLRKSSYLLVNLTTADLLVGVSRTIAGINFESEFNLSEIFERFLIMLTTCISIVTLSVISVERVLAVFWPFHHRLAKRWNYFTAIGVVLAVFNYIFYNINLRNPQERSRSRRHFEGRDNFVSFSNDITNNHIRLIFFHLDQNDILHQVSSLQNNSREQ
jgi:hypothetical protein